MSKLIILFKSDGLQPPSFPNDSVLSLSMEDKDRWEEMIDYALVSLFHSQASLYFVGGEDAWTLAKLYDGKYFPTFTSEVLDVP